MIRPGSLRFTVLLGALTAMTSFAVDMSLPALPTLTAVFRTTPDRVQLTLSLFLLGYAGGQLFYGPLSDRFGRRPLLLLGLVVYALAGFVCAASPSIEVLVLARLVQGFGACVGPILGRAVVRDHFAGTRAAQVLSYITLVFAVAPLVAPILGGFVLEHFGWPAIFLTFGIFGSLLLVVAWAGFGESLKAPDPQALQFPRLAANARRFFANRRCVGYALMNACVYGGLLAFISGSPFVLIEVYRVPAAHFGFYFGLSAVGIMLGALANSRLLRRLPPDRVLRLGLILLVAAGLAALAQGGTRWGGPLLMMAPIVAYLFAQGMIMPNAIAQALEPLPQMAGMGASLLGAVQMAGGSLSGYIVSVLFDGTPLPMAAMIAVMGGGAFLAYHLVVLSKMSRASEDVTTL